MRSGPVVPTPLGRKKLVSRQRGSVLGQSASVAQNAEQLPIIGLLVDGTHCQGCAVGQYCAGSVREVGVVGHAAPGSSVPNAGRQYRTYVSLMACPDNEQRCDEGQSASR